MTGRESVGRFMHAPTAILSIVIPTRNRATYAVPAIRAILAIPRDDFEIVVHDNSDDSGLDAALGPVARDPRLAYQWDGRRKSGIENFNEALSRATGEYVTVLGDDDGVNPELLDAVAWSRSQDLDALLPSRPAQYWWPDIRFRYRGSRMPATLELDAFSSEVSYPSAAQAMRTCVQAAGLSFGDLPRIYYGVVRRRCLEELKARAGSYCRVSPDMSGAMGVAGFVRSVAKIDYPLFLPGSSGNSGAGLGARGKHVGTLDQQPFLSAACIRDWSEFVPKFFSGSTMWGEACVQTLRAIGREDLLREFNVPLLHARCLAFHPDWARLVLTNYYRALRATRQSPTMGSVRLLSGYCGTWFKRARALAGNLTKSSTTSRTRIFPDIPDIEVATEKLQSVLRAEGWSLGAVLERAEAALPALRKAS
jgi:hypothetical protein